MFLLFVVSIVDADGIAPVGASSIYGENIF